AGADEPVLVAVHGAVEDLVLDPDEGAALQREVAAPGQAHRRAACGPVERLGGGSPPGGDGGVPAPVGDGQPADVEGLARVAVDAPEDEGRVADLEMSEPVAHRLFDDVALVASLVGAAPPDLGQPTQPKCLLTGPIEAVVRMLDVGLL